MVNVFHWVAQSNQLCLLTKCTMLKARADIFRVNDNNCETIREVILSGGPSMLGCAMLLDSVENERNNVHNVLLHVEIERVRRSHSWLQYIQVCLQRYGSSSLVM